MPFLKTLSEKIKHIIDNEFCYSNCKTFNLYTQDESRFGLMTIQRRIITTKGIKPILPFQHRFQYLYLFGAFSPITGDHFTLEFPQCNSDCFQQYLEELSAYKPDEFKVLILDNGAFHKAKTLCIPKNIKLIFIPPYSPELNSSEKMWQYLKDKMANKIFKTIDDLSNHIAQTYQNLTDEIVQSITGFPIYKQCHLIV